MRFGTILGLLFLSALGPASSEPDSEIDSFFACPTVAVELSAANVQEQALVCRAAENARDFFLAHGIMIQRPIRVRLQSDELMSHANHIGLYDAREDTIHIVTLEHAVKHRREDSPFDTRMDRSLYASFVSHEIAHAIAYQYSGATLSTLAQEYLAYVTQISTMPMATRTSLLARFDEEAFADVDDISMIYYQLNPNAFGIKAFLHYSTLPDKSGFVRDLLAGEIKMPATQLEWW